MAGAGYGLLLRLLVDTLDSWSYSAAHYHKSIHWTWSASWSDAALTLLLYFGSGAGLCWLHWAFYSGNTPAGDESERPSA